MLELACWCYLAGLAAVWSLLYFGGDRWWFATVLLFSPRWAWGLPLWVLVPMSAIWRRRCLLVLAPAAAIVVVPIMGLCCGFSRLAPAGPQLRLLTCNVDGESLRAEALRALVLQTKPDVISLQEFAGSEQWLLDALPAGFHIVRVGELAVASPYPLFERSRRQETPKDGWPFCDGVCCEVEIPGGPVYVCCMHLSTPRRGLAEVLDRRTVLAPGRSETLRRVIERRGDQSAKVSRWAADLPRPLVLTGDFNMPADSRIYRQSWSSYGNAFSAAGLGFGGTKITPVGPISYGLRIDHVLFDPPFRAARAWVGPDVGSDHLPLLADLYRD
jgi:endonuclease/exonuclease/phosphatase (EEP) superfamily protein YafD